MTEKWTLMNGNTVTHDGNTYKIIRVHSIEDEHTIYEVEGHHRRLLMDGEFDTTEVVEFDQVRTLWHYALDFDKGVITENKAFGIVFGDKIAVYSPDFKGYLTEANLRQGKVSKSFNMFLSNRNPNKAKIDITKAVSDRCKFYEAKARSYVKLWNKLG